MQVINTLRGGEKPVLLTDVDGVFLVCDEEVPGRRPVGYEVGPAGNQHEFYNPRHGQWLKELLPLVDWYWLTSHDDKSHDDIGQHLHLPETAWVDFRTFEAQQRREERAEGKISSDINYPRRQAIDAYFKGRILVWIEDEITQHDTSWWRQRQMREAPTLLIRPDSAEGLQYFHIDRAKAWLGRLATGE